MTRTPGPPEPPPEARAFLVAYEPDLADAEHAPLVRELAAWYGPKDAPQARRAAAAFSGLVHWAHSTGVPLDPDTLLDDDVRENYLGELPLAERTVENHRSLMQRTSRRRAGQAPRRTRKGPVHRDAPYTPEEVDALLVWARYQPNDLRADALLAVLVLGLGAGLSNADIVTVRGTDVTRTAAHPDDPAGTVLVRTHGKNARSVPLLARYGTEALRVAAAAGDGWIVNPGVEPTATTRPEISLHRQITLARPGSAPRLTTNRCRTTWICHHLAAGTRIDVLAAAAGIVPERVTDGARFLESPDPAAATRQLRDAAP